MKKHVEFSEIALNDLDEIYDYILLNSFDIKTAETFIEGIIDCCKLLNDNPLLGKEVYLLQEKTKYRYLVYKKYIIFYAVKKQVPIIYRVLNSRRDYITTLFNDNL